MFRRRLGERVRGLLGAAGLLALVLQAPAAEGPDFGDSATAVSQSGQFVVMGPRSGVRRPIEMRRPGEPVRRLTPQTLAVSCERVKDQVLEALAMPDRWRAGGGRTGKIYVGIDPLMRTNAALAVEAGVFEQGWQFRVAVPVSVTEDRLVRALAQAVVMELASRSGKERPGEPPMWLVEGLTQTVLASAPEGIVLQPETRMVVDARAGQGMTPVRDRLSRRPPLAFHELSQPSLQDMSVADWEHYAACAHLCFRELSRLPEGRERLAQWLAGLQRHWNWQTGFLEAFEPRFRSLLDVEKWWALAVASFTGRNQASTWTPEFALRKLNEALSPMAVVPGNGGRARRVALEEILTSWEFSRQIPTLRQLLLQLQAVRVNAPQSVSSLVFRYGDVLEEYLEARGRAGYSPVTRGAGYSNVRWITREAVGRLRLLDGERRDLAAQPPAPAPAPAETALGSGT